MDNVKQISGKATTLAAASAIQKAIRPLIDAKPGSGGQSKTGKASATNEIELLKSLCKSDNPQTAQLAVQALVQLVNRGTLDLAQVLAILVTLLATQSPAHFAAVSNGIVELLLLDLRRRCSVLGSARYVCQFDIKPPQHPLILLLGSKDVNCMLFFGAKVNEICQHHDQLIRKNSVEFLRPVFLYIFNNVSTFPETLKIWRTILKCAATEDAAIGLIYEIIAWSKSSSGDKCLFTNNLLLEALDTLPDDTRCAALRIDLCMCLAANTKDLVASNYDPSDNFLHILAVLHSTKREQRLNYNILLMVFADLLQNLAPGYVLGFMRVIRFLLGTGCHRLSRLMIMDGAVQLLGQQTFIQSYLEDCDNILNAILNDQRDVVEETNATSSFAWAMHADLAKYHQINVWWASIQKDPNSLKTFLNINAQHSRFGEKVQLVLRGLFYMEELAHENWRQLFDQLIALSKKSEENCARLMTPMLFALANDTDPRKKLLLLHQLASMGAKDHVLGVLKALSKDIDRATSLDLYLRLWKAEPRTYPFLYDILKDTTVRPREDPWEVSFARTFTIREICLIKPQQHGADLVNLFSEILSHPEDANNEAAVALAIDAIAVLCENHVVNIVSTWKVLGFKFSQEKRPRIIRRLCNFFSNVPSIKVNSIEQEKLVNEIITTLWHYVTDFDDREVIVAALQALKTFPPDMMNIFHVPDIFRQKIALPDKDDERLDAREIPGECWIQLIQYVNHSAIEEAGDLVAHHIRNEIQAFRGGVYLTPEGRPEPSSLKYLPNKSILVTVIHHLINQSDKRDGNDLVLANLLRVVAKRYPKPIPPLNWCFLHDYFHRGDDMKKFCLQIALKQMPHSGTAKRIVENFLAEMIEGDMVASDVLTILESLDVVTEATNVDIFKSFAHLALQFLLERSEGDRFDGPDPFGSAIPFLKVAVQKTYQNEENYEYLCETLENLFSRFELDSKAFEDYIGVLSLLPIRQLTSLLKPSTWMDKRNVRKLKKVIHLQFSIQKYENISPEVHLLGLSDILKTIIRLEANTADEVQRFFGQSFNQYILAFGSQKVLTEWIVELIGYIQSNLAEQSVEMKEILFMLDTFLMVVIALAGYVCLTGEDALVENPEKRLSLFPASLIMVFKHNLWREIENKIYEFLYHLYNHAKISDQYANCFRNALLCCKEQSYFQQPKAWPKFVALRRLPKN
uniref:Uncharacterized protein n=1 Tax=Culex tarsalis TaxID=7177 RepID=A0A1Q3F5H2_CULTA